MISSNCEDHEKTMLSGDSCPFSEPKSPKDDELSSLFAERSQDTQGTATGLAQRSQSNKSDSLLDQALEFTQHHLKQQCHDKRLDRPIVVPQVSSGFGMPFARGYSDSLGDHGISMDEFLEFIDNYNIVSGGSPPFAIIDLAGGVVGMVPIHHAQIISGALTAVSKLGQLGWNPVNKSRATKFLEKSNADFFNPRGLKVEVASSKAVKSKLGMNADAPLVLAAEESHGLSVHERRMASLRDYAAPVVFDVPPPNEQTATLKRMAAAQQKRTLEKQEKKALEDREKYAEKKAEAEQKIVEKGSKADKEALKLDRAQEKVMNKYQKEAAKIEKDAEKDTRKGPEDSMKAERKKADEMTKLDRELQSELRRIEKEREKLNKEYQEEEKKENKGAQKDDKEREASEKILWILVGSL